MSRELIEYLNERADDRFLGMSVVTNGDVQLLYAQTDAETDWLIEQTERVSGRESLSDSSSRATKLGRKVSEIGCYEEGFLLSIPFDQRQYVIWLDETTARNLGNLLTECLSLLHEEVPYYSQASPE